MDLIGARELFSSWPSTRTSLCQAFSSSSRSARVRSLTTRSWCGRPPSRNIERVMAQRPAPDGKVRWTVRAGLAFQELGQAQGCRVSGQNAFGGLLQEPLSGAIHQAQAMLAVEGEHRHVDFLHHFAQERGGLQRAQALRPQRRAHGVDLVHDVGQRVFRFRGARAAAANRVVAFAHGLEQVRQRAQRRRHALAYGRSAGPPDPQDQDGERPLDFGRVVRRSTEAPARR